MSISKHFLSQVKNQSQVLDNQVVTPPPPPQKPCQTKNIMYKFLRIFLAGWFLFSCSSDEPEVVEALKKANAKDFSFSLLSVNAKEVSVEKIKSILKNPTGWTIKSLKIDDESFAEVTGTSVKDFKIKIKKAGEFSFSVTLQKTGYEDFILKGVKIKVTFLADAKDFSFKLLELTGANEVTIEQIKKNLKSPTGWTIKSLKIDDESFAEVTGTSVKYFKIKIKKTGAFSFSITLQKTGYEDFILKGTIKVNASTEPPKKADPSKFGFPLLPVNAKEVSFAVLRGNLTSPAGWTIKTIAVVDSSFGEVTGAGINQKITIKKDGTFAINITLQKMGYEDFVLQGKIKASTPTQPLKKADAKDFNFPLLPVNGAEVSFAVLRGNLTSPAGWTIKSIAVADSSFGAVTGAGSNQKITIKKDGTFAINITLGKTGYEDFVLKGVKIKASTPTQPPKKADPSNFSFPELPVNAKEIPIATIQSNLKKPTGWTIKSIAVADSDFGDVTGAGSSQKIVLKKGGTFVINITLQKAGWADFVLKGNIKAAKFTATASDFSFPELSVNAKEIPIAKIESNLTKPTGWTIKTITVADSSFGDVTGAGSSQKIVLKKGGTFAINITLEKAGYADFVLKGNIKAANLTATASGFSFPELPVNAKEIPFATIESNLTKPDGWTIKSITVADSDFGAVTGAGDSQKITIKKDGEFAINITLGKTGWVDFVLKGTIKASTPTQPLKKADAKDFSFPLLEVNAKEILLDDIKRRIMRPASWTIKSIAVVDTSFGDVTGTKIVLKKGGTFGINITLEKAGYADYVLQGNVKATLPTDSSKFVFEKALGAIKGIKDKTIKTINIPDKIDGISVTSIGDYAFMNSSVASVTIPNSVNIIGRRAFFSCNALTSVTIPSSVISIGDEAFKFSYNLTSVTINCNINFEIRDKFDEYTLTSITIGNSVTFIGDNAFRECQGLTSMTIPNSVTAFGGAVFYKCSSLTSVTIGNSVTTIKRSVFYKCTRLTSVTIGNSVTTIEAYAFDQCPALISLTIPNTVTTIEDDAFVNSSLRSLTLNCNINFKIKDTFSSFRNITNVTIGKLGYYDWRWSISKLVID